MSHLIINLGNRKSLYAADLLKLSKDKTCMVSKSVDPKDSIKPPATTPNAI
jgi:hypothetical protein